MANNRRFPRAKWVLPEVVDPPDRLCFQIEVPNERQHIAAFYGALYNLTSAIFWQDDTAHTAKAVALVWRDIFDNLRRGCDCPPLADLIAEMDYDMSICEQLRFNDQGVLEGFCCGEWAPIQNAEKFELAHPGQEGGDAPQPETGEEICYHFAQQGNLQYLLPTVVSDGDTLTFSNMNGASSDGLAGPLSRWDCVDGNIFFGGKCQPGTQNLDGADPLPTAPHMSIVVQIAGTWYSALSVITVPGGVSNAQVVIQLNDDTIGDNQGSYSGDCCVANNQLAEWTSTLDFALNSYASIRTGGYGVWTAGTGLQGESNGTEPYVIQPTITVTAFNMTGWQITYNCVSVGGIASGMGLYQIGAASGYLCGILSVSGGTGIVEDCTASASAVTGVQPTINSGTTGGQVTLTKLVIRGTGPKPPELP